MEYLLVFLGIGLLMFVIITYGAFSWGIVVYCFWDWFILPVFQDLPAITYLEAVGIGIFISLFRNHGDNGIKEQYKDNDRMIGSAILSPWMVLLFGWVISHFL